MQPDITGKRPAQAVPVRVVADANAWVSRYLTPRGVVAARLRYLVRSSRFTLIFSKELRDEITEVIRRDKFRRFIQPDELKRYLRQVASYALSLTSSTIAVCRDPKDNYLLGLSLDARADFLITGDKDLLVLGRFGSTEIVSWAVAAQRLGLDARSRSTK